MRRNYKFIIILVLVFIISFTTMVSGRVYVWYLPHPDDETIGMADAIHRSVVAGNQNYVIYFTRGGASKVRHRLTGSQGKVINLTRDQLEEARIKETLAALEVLGVKSSNVLFLNFKEGNIGQLKAQKIMENFIELYPQGVHNTVAAETHEDHQVLARALATLADERELSTRFYQVYIYRQQANSKNRKVKVRFPEVKQAALEEFKVWDPQQGRYAIGQHSVPKLLQKAAESNYEYLATHSSIDNNFNIQPTTLRILSDGFGFAYQYQQLSLGTDLRLDLSSKDLDLATYSLYKLPDQLPFIDLAAGIGYDTTKNFYWSINTVIVDDLIIEYHNYTNEQKIRFGIQLRL
ncbi:MAG: PIG-L family deacetylase [Bacillota bacterium]